MHFTFAEDFLEGKKHFLEFYLCFLLSLELQEKKLECCRNISGSFAKFAYYLSTRILLEKSTFWRKFNFWTLLDFERITFGLLEKNIKQVCWSCILRVQGNSLRKNRFLKNFENTIFYRTWAKNYRNNAKIFQQICQNCTLRV